MKMVIGDRESAKVRGSNYGVRTETHTRTINGRVYKFDRMTWRDGRVELWARPIGPTRGSRHHILGFNR